MSFSVRFRDQASSFGLFTRCFLLSLLVACCAAGTARAEEIAPAETSTLHVIIGLGQSLMVGSQSGDSLISTEPVWPDQVLMFDVGEKSDVRIGLVTGGNDRENVVLDPNSITGFRPLVARRGQGSGNRGETLMESLANTLATEANSQEQPFRVLAFTAGFGGSAYSALKKGGQVYANMLIALNKAVELAAIEGWNVVVAGCVIKHGEGDLNNSNYLNNLLEWRNDVDADVKAITGQTSDVHFIMNQPTTHRGTTAPQSSLAMLEAHNTSPFHHLAGADYPFGTEYAADELHMTGPGYFHIGEQMARAWQQALWSGAGKAKITQITDASRTGTTVTLTYEVPVPPLVLDTTTVPERDAKGFRFFDSTGEIPIVGVAVTDDGTGTGVGEITLELARASSGIRQRIIYALSPQSSTRSAENRVRGNVRDSAPETSAYDGRPLYNWAVVQEFSIPDLKEPELDVIVDAPFLAGATVRGLAVNEATHPLLYFPQGDSLRANIGSGGGATTMRHHNPILIFQLPETLPEGGIKWELRFHKQGGANNQDNADLYGLDPRKEGFALSEVLWYHGPEEDPRPFATRIAGPAMLPADAPGTSYSFDVTAFIETFYDGDTLRADAELAYFRLNPAVEIPVASLRRQEIVNTVGDPLAPTLELRGNLPPAPPVVEVTRAAAIGGAFVRGAAQNSSTHPIGFHLSGPATETNSTGTTGNSGSRRHNNPIMIFELPEELPEEGNAWELIFHKQSSGNPKAVDLYGLDPRAPDFALNEVLFYEGPETDGRAFASLLAKSIMTPGDPDGTEYTVNVTDFIRSFYEGRMLLPEVENGRVYFRLNLDEVIGTSGPHRQNIYNQIDHELGPVLRLMKVLSESAAYRDWAESFDLDLESDGAPEADPDQDGFSNRLEFAFGASPIDPDGSLFETRREGDNLVLTFLALASGADYEVETTLDLSAESGWAPAPSAEIIPGSNEPEPPVGYTRQQAIIEVAGAPARQFFRLRVTFPDF